MSTYIQGGDILVKVFKRFMVFAQNGQFKDEVEFNDDAYRQSDLQNEDHIEQLMSHVDRKAMMDTLGSNNKDNNPVRPKILIRDFLGLSLIHI